jgi:high-affinity iron transporter
MGAFVITLREGFEAALIVSLILAYLAKTGNLQEHARTVWIGVAGAVAASFVVGAILFGTVGELEGKTEELYEGTAMLLAAGVVTWMVFWMRRQATTIGRHLREQVGNSLRAGGGVALAAIAFVGVAREGVETALFLFASTEDSGVLVTVVASAAGLLAALVLGVLFYRGALRLDLKRFFTVTGLLVIVLAAYLLNGALHELGEVAGSEALEQAAMIVPLLYAGGFAALYLRGVRSADAGRQAGEPAPQPEI